VNQSLDIDVTPRRVRQILCGVGLKGRKPAKKPLLTAVQREQRLKWARQHEEWTPDDWERVIWSDESGFERISSRQQWVRRRDGERFEKECIKATVKHGGGKVQVWGCFHANSIGPLFRIDGIMNAAAYHSILAYHAIPFVAQVMDGAPGGTTIVWQHDNDPKHTAKVNKSYLEQKCDEKYSRGQRMVVMDWPSQSPDLNPIENLWDHIKDSLHAKQRFSSLDALFQAIKCEWNQISKAYLKDLVHGMPRRVQAVIAAEGGHTKY